MGVRFPLPAHMKKIISLLLAVCGVFLAAPHAALAHVSYVLTPTEIAMSRGVSWSYILEPFTHLNNVLLMLLVGLLLVLTILVAETLPLTKKILAHTKEKLSSYHEFIPWILRLALGISLIGSGAGEVLISPTLSHGIVFGIVQFILGFCFLSGFMILPSALMTLLLYVYGLTHEIYLLGNLDFFVLALSIFFFHSPRPGFDDIFNLDFIKLSNTSRHFIAPLVRVGLGVSFIYLALHEKLLNPMFSNLVVENFHLTHFIPVSANMWVLGAGLIELVLGICILIGFYTRLSSVISILVISVTFFYFKESVYAHVTLFSALAILAIEGGGVWSVDRFLASRK